MTLHRFACRVYFAIIQDGTDAPAEYYSYSEGWISRASEGYKLSNGFLTSSSSSGSNGSSNSSSNSSSNHRIKEGSGKEDDAGGGDGQLLWCSDAAAALNVSRDRYCRLSTWRRYREFYPQFRAILRQVVERCEGKLRFKRGVTSFELFGADFVVGADSRPWLLELNRSPRQTEDDRPMLHALLDIVLREHRTPSKHHRPGGPGPGPGPCGGERESGEAQVACDSGGAQSRGGSEALRNENMGNSTTATRTTTGRWIILQPAGSPAAPQPP